MDDIRYNGVPLEDLLHLYLSWEFVQLVRNILLGQSDVASQPEELDSSSVIE